MMQELNTMKIKLEMIEKLKIILNTFLKMRKLIQLVRLLLNLEKCLFGREKLKNTEEK